MQVPLYCYLVRRLTREQFPKSAIRLIVRPHAMNDIPDNRLVQPPGLWIEAYLSRFCIESS